MVRLNGVFKKNSLSSLVGKWEDLICVMIRQIYIRRAQDYKIIHFDTMESSDFIGLTL